MVRNINDAYTYKEAARYLGYTRTMMYHLIKKGYIRVYTHKVSGYKYFLKRDLDLYKNRDKIAADAAKPIDMKVLKKSEKNKS